MQTVPRDLRIEQIIDHAFEDLMDWARPEVLEGSIGPGFPEVFVKFEERLRKLREDLRTALQKFDDVELDRNFPPSTTATLNLLYDRRGLLSSLARRLYEAKREKPLNFVGGWSIEETKVEIRYWRMFETYSLDEAALLCVGRDPRKTSYNPLMKLYGRSSEADELLYFLEELHDAIANGLGLDPEDGAAVVDARALLQWVQSRSVQIDQRFRRILKEYLPVRSEEPMKPLEPMHEEKPLHGSSYKAVARVVWATAIQKYGLKHEGDIGRVVQEMVHDGELVGLTFDRKVARDLLASAVDQLRRREQPSKRVETRRDSVKSGNR